MIPLALAYPLALLPFVALLGALVWMARSTGASERPRPAAPEVA
jgi:hypothetical protein